MHPDSKERIKRWLPEWVLEARRAVRKFAALELVEGPLSYNQDGLATQHNCDFLRDEKFARSYDLGRSTGSWLGGEPAWRAYVACWAAERASRLEGDFVECGVNRGGFSRTVMEYVHFRSLPKKFYLLDTFSGLVKGCISEAERKRGIKPGGYEECHDFVQNVFSEFENVEIIRGEVPGTLPLVKAQQVSYLSLDMNCAAPEIAAAEFFWDKLVSGGVMLLDDYGWAMHVNQKLAHDEFASRKGVPILSLPTGQGMVIKP
jgi:O-methyltransferase